MSKPLPVMPYPASVQSVEEFRRLDLRIGTILSATDHPQADRLLVLTVDVGGETRQLVAGIKGPYQAAELAGKQIIVVANLAPATIRGVESQGMVLAAKDSIQLALLVPERPIQAGSTVK